MNRTRWLAALLIAAITLWIATGAASSSDIERGRYMVLTGHCNNCHTGYSGKQGKVPDKDWLIGNPVGYRLPTGTTYASNLRLSVQPFTEDQWVQYPERGSQP